MKLEKEKGKVKEIILEISLLNKKDTVFLCRY